MKVAMACALHLRESFYFKHGKAVRMCLYELNRWILNTEFLAIMSDAQMVTAEVSTMTGLC